MSVHQSNRRKTGIYRSEYNGTISMPDGTAPIPLGSGVIQRLIGEGGTSLVYEIWNEQLGIHRAIKLLKPTASRDSRERFSREIKILAQLNHPNIINVHAVGEWNDLPYIEMDLVDGLSLDQLIVEMGALPLQVVLAMSIFIARALDYTHSHRYRIDNVDYIGLLHRDLKPANILLPKNDILRLTDFGIASFSTVAVTATSSTGMVTGSMQYLAPEQLDEGVVDHRSDIFSFGCTLYEMLTGERAFPEKHIAKLVKIRVQNDYKPLRKWKLKIPSQFESFVTACLAHSPANRPNSMKDILHFLEELYKKVESRRPEDIIRSYVNGEKMESKKYRRGMRHTLSRSKSFFQTIPGMLMGVIMILLVVGLTIFGLVEFGIIDGPPKRRRSNHESGVVSDVLTGEKLQQLSRKKNRTPLEELILSKGTQDTMSILENLDNEERYELLTEIIDDLPLSMKARKGVRLRKHRAVVALGKESFSYYNGSHISDGEYVFNKGRFLYEQKQFQRSIWLLRDAEETPALLRKSTDLKREIAYYRALAESGLADKKRSNSAIEAAVKSWGRVKDAWKKESYHPNYKKAVAEIKRLERMR